MTCLLSCSVCAFTPTTFTACEGKKAGQPSAAGRPPRPRLLRRGVHLVSYVDLGEAEGLQVNAGGPDGRSDGFHQQLLQILADERPGLLDDLQEKIHSSASETALNLFYLAAEKSQS